MLRDDLLELQRRFAVQRVVPEPAPEAPPTPGEMPELPDFLVRQRTPESDERCRRYIEEDQKRPLVGGIAGLFRAHDENEQRKRLGGGYL